MLDDSIKNEAEAVPDEIEDETAQVTPEEHYQWAMGLLAKRTVLLPSHSDQIPILLEAIAHALLGGLRDGLDYAARQAGKVPPTSGGGGGGYAPPLFEEDDDRP
jgi:hypothetical protein